MAVLMWRTIHWRTSVMEGI